MENVNLSRATHTHIQRALVFTQRSTFTPNDDDNNADDTDDDDAMVSLLIIASSALRRPDYCTFTSYHDLFLHVSLHTASSTSMVAEWLR